MHVHVRVCVCMCVHACIHLCVHAQCVLVYIQHLTLDYLLNIFSHDSTIADEINTCLVQHICLACAFTPSRTAMPLVACNRRFYSFRPSWID